MSTDRIESTDKSHPKYKLKHRFTDMELDYLDDADNPLDQADNAKKTVRLQNWLQQVELLNKWLVQAQKGVLLRCSRSWV